MGGGKPVVIFTKKDCTGLFNSGIVSCESTHRGDLGLKIRMKQKHNIYTCLIILNIKTCCGQIRVPAASCVIAFILRQREMVVLEIMFHIREHPLSTYAPRGRGGSKKPENMRTIVLIGCVKSVQEGGRGSKKPENLRTYLMDAP